MSGKPSRELTQAERKAIRKLVMSTCASYDKKYGCLPLDYGRCYMLDKWWAGAYCTYFLNNVLPNDPVLESALTGNKIPDHIKPCEVCGGMYAGDGRRRYCSPKCADAGRKRALARRVQKHRKMGG